MLALLIASVVSGRSVGPDSGVARALDPLAATGPEIGPMQRGGLSLQEAVRIATEQHPGGRVVRAVTIEDSGRRVHEIRIVLPADEGGRVVTVTIPAGEAR